MSEANEMKDSGAGRASGPDQQLVAAAAERTGPETMPEGERAVAPGEARPVPCPVCGTPNTDNWPVDVDGEIQDGGCQECWEAECDREWWKCVAAIQQAEAGQRSSRSERSGRRNAELTHPDPKT